MGITEIQKASQRTLARFGVIVLMAVTVVQLTSCGAEKDSGPESPPAPAPVAPKPDVTGVKLTPKGFAASKSLPGKEPAHVVDGDLGLGWGSGDHAPQWIQLDLGETTSISDVLLNVDQFPEGMTIHEVHGGPTTENLKLLGTASGDTSAGQWIEVKVMANDIRYVRIVTTKSPSWVAWNEIEVYK